MNDLSNFIGGCIIGGVFVTIITLAFTTFYWLHSDKATYDIDEFEKEQKKEHIKKSFSGLKYNDGLDIDSWIYR